MTSANILAMVLAGGEGTRLRPLTADHAKPALPFARGYRIVDFVLSNLVNSDIQSIYVLAQYKPQSLVGHIDRAWTSTARDSRPGVKVVMPCNGTDRYRGTADAVLHSIDLIERHRPDLVAVFAADHVYRMDIRQMVDFHLGCGADLSVAAVPVPIGKASTFGVIVSGHDGRIRDFQEKPAQPAPLPADPTRAFASMGNYLFNPDLLVDMLQTSVSRGGTDFGKHVLPAAVRDHRTFAYDFSNNKVPGLLACEERGYWRDVGTLEAYAAARCDVMGPRPRFSLENRDWPIGANIGRPIAPQHAIHNSSRPEAVAAMAPF